jgi:hypothetical protein
MKPPRVIPDLRLDQDQITLDHCYVLLVKLSEALDVISGTKGQFDELVNGFDPTVIQEDLQKYLNAPEFSRLFQNESPGFGKGVLVGFYAKELWIKLKGDPNEIEEDDY